jgi:hypothetical protein
MCFLQRGRGRNFADWDEKMCVFGDLFIFRLRIIFGCVELIDSGLDLIKKPFLFK